MTNEQRRARARQAYDAVRHDNAAGVDDITNVIDLVADLLHLADEFHQGEGSVPDTVGEWVAEKATEHYQDEIDETIADERAALEAAVA